MHMVVKTEPIKGVFERGKDLVSNSRKSVTNKWDQVRGKFEGFENEALLNFSKAKLRRKTERADSIKAFIEALQTGEQAIAFGFLKGEQLNVFDTTAKGTFLFTLVADDTVRTPVTDKKKRALVITLLQKMIDYSLTFLKDNSEKREELNNQLLNAQKFLSVEREKQKKYEEGK